MIIYQFIYIWPISFTEYATLEVTWRVMPRLKISGSNTQGMNPPPRPPLHTHTHTHILKSLIFVFNKVHLIIDRDQGFIQTILISGRSLKKLNLLIEFWNSIFIKFYFKACWDWTCIQKKLACKVSFILSYLFVLQMKKILKYFRGFSFNLLRSLQHLKIPTCIL